MSNGRFSLALHGSFSASYVDDSGARHGARFRVEAMIRAPQSHAEFPRDEDVDTIHRDFDTLLLESFDHKDLSQSYGVASRQQIAQVVLDVLTAFAKDNGLRLWRVNVSDRDDRSLSWRASHHSSEPAS